MRVILLTLLAAACDGDADTGDPVTKGFCLDLNDGNTSVMEDGGATGSSGVLNIRVITSESDDPRDPLWVAFKPFTLEPTETGGIQTTGETSGDGLVVKTVGAGLWSFEAAYTRGSSNCTATMEIEVEAERTTYACPVLSCPE